MVRLEAELDFTEELLPVGQRGGVGGERRQIGQGLDGLEFFGFGHRVGIMIDFDAI